MTKQIKSEKKKMNPLLWFLFAVITPVMVALCLLLIILNVAGVDVSGWAKDKAGSVPFLSGFVFEEELTIAENKGQTQAKMEEKDAEIDRLLAEIRELETTVERLNQDIVRLENRNEQNNQANEEEQASDAMPSISGTFKDMDHEQAALILQNMDEDTVITILNEVSNKVRGQILEAMDPEIAADLTQLLIDS
jgi:septal ring factor EnvC (AmiA/AmiB activator)